MGYIAKTDERWSIAEIDGLKLWVDRNDDVSSGILDGSFEPAEIAFLKRTVKPGMTFVDVGANIGWFTLQAARAVGPTGRVISFEPRRDTFSYLAQSVAANGFSQVKFHNLACGAEAGTMAIGWSEESGGRGGTWVLPDQALIDDFKRLEKTIEQTRVCRLDDFIRRCDVMKMDIEGAEVLAVRGAERLLAQSRPIILCEINPGLLELVSHSSAREFIALMRFHGYGCHMLTEDGLGEEYDGGPLPNDIGNINVVMTPTHCPSKSRYSNL